MINRKYKELVAVCVLLLLVGGCIYYVNRSYSSNNSFVENRVVFDQVTGKKMKKCPWCGGIGRAGYAGASEIQYDQLEKVKGDYCKICSGTGYVKDNAQ